MPPSVTSPRSHPWQGCGSDTTFHCLQAVPQEPSARRAVAGPGLGQQQEEHFGEPSSLKDQRSAWLSCSRMPGCASSRALGLCTTKSLGARRHGAGDKRGCKSKPLKPETHLFHPGLCMCQSFSLSQGSTARSKGAKQSCFR